MAKLYFKYSAMNAGKSTALLQVAFNYESDLACDIIIFTAEIDTRFGEGRVTSRIGIDHAAIKFNSYTNISQKISDITQNNDKRIDCILVDEAQFLTKIQVVDLHKFAHLQGVPVMCYGIRTDFMGNTFPGSAALLSIADDIQELKNLCSRCVTRKATMNPRVDNKGHRIMEGPQVGIESTAYKYAPMCPKCFYESELI